jgi:hypothetical protein
MTISGDVFKRLEKTHYSFELHVLKVHGGNDSILFDMFDIELCTYMYSKFIVEMTRYVVLLFDSVQY